MYSVLMEISKEISGIDMENDDVVNKEVQEWCQCFENLGYSEPDWKISKIVRSSNERLINLYRLEMELYKRIDIDYIDDFQLEMSNNIEDYGFTIVNCDIGKIIGEAIKLR